MLLLQRTTNSLLTSDERQAPEFERDMPSAIFSLAFGDAPESLSDDVRERGKAVWVRHDDAKIGTTAADRPTEHTPRTGSRAPESEIGRLEDPMTVHVVIREDQNEHGFVDASVVGLFRSRKDPNACLQSSLASARKEGIRVSGDPGAEPDWEVSWTIESHALL